MRLSGLTVRNYRRIGNIECNIKIDEIVVLIGPNNAGKSTVLDAYELFASAGKEVDVSHFHGDNAASPIEITGIFSDVSAEDLEVLGKAWLHQDEVHGDCIKVRWIWKSPGQKGQKESFDPSSGTFVQGGVGGWDSLIQSRIPQPIRIRPTDPVETTQTKVVAMLKDHIKAKLKQDSSSTKTALDEIERITEKLLEESKGAVQSVSDAITKRVADVFPGTTIEVIPRSKDTLDEKVLGADSFLKIKTDANPSVPFALQGTGLQRALLWSALSVMSDAPNKSKTKTSDEVQKILLIDEPEAFLHPPTIRNARDSLYDFALKIPTWQVIATTHSPIFIDLSKKHTTVVRVDANSTEQHFVSTDKMSFDAPTRKRLQMIRSCNPIVNEFFFFDNIILVEGPTEQLVVQFFAEKLGKDVHVINCIGKANIPIFAGILNHFRVSYVVVHDSDTPKCKRKKAIIGNPMWTMNGSIRDAVSAGTGSHIYVQFPNFEGAFCDEELHGGKVDNVIEILADDTSDVFKLLEIEYTKIINKATDAMCNTLEAFSQKRDFFTKAKSLEQDWRWFDVPEPVGA